MNEIMLRRPMFDNPRAPKVSETKRNEKPAPKPHGKPLPA